MVATDPEILDGISGSRIHIKYIRIFTSEVRYGRNLTQGVQVEVSLWECLYDRHSSGTCGKQELVNQSLAYRREQLHLVVEI